MKKGKPSAATVAPRNAPRQPHGRETGRDRGDAWSLAVPLLVAAVTFAAFFPALSNQLLQWDDQATITENVHIRGLSLANVHWMFTHFFMGHYQPLALLTMALDYQIWGMEPFGFHLTNVLLHAANAAVFYLLTVRLLRLALPACGASPWACRSGAIAAALLFSLHPLRVESVAWATERRDVLSALFYLAAILAYVIAHERRLGGRPAMRWMIAMTGLAMISLLARMIAFTLVPVLLILDIYPLRRWSAPWAASAGQVRRLIVEKLPLAILAVTVVLATTRAQAEYAAWAGLETHRFTLRAMGALFSLSFYLWKSLVPLGLSPLYEMPATPGDVDWRFVLAGVGGLAIGPIWLAWRRRWDAFLSAWACYVVILTPTLGLFQHWPQIAADRYTYLSCLGWAICVGGMVTLFAAKWKESSVRFAAGVGAAAVLTAVALLTSAQLRVWHDDIALWGRALAVDPNSGLAMYGMGTSLLEQNRPADAEPYLRRALPRRTRMPDVPANLGMALGRIGRYDEAIQFHHQSLSIQDNAPARAGLAYVYAKKDRFDEAEREIRRALALKPDERPSHELLATILAKQGRRDEAIDEYRWVISRHPAEWPARRKLAELLVARGDAAAALQALQEAVVAGPSDPRRFDALAQTMVAAPHVAPPAEAIRAATTAVKLSGGQAPEFIDTLARAEAAAGDTTRAIATARKACIAAERTGNDALLQRCRETLAQISTQPAR